MSDPTIGSCWDADRLDLPRGGAAVHPAMMSTARGRELAAEGAPLEDVALAAVLATLLGAARVMRRVHRGGVGMLLPVGLLGGLALSFAVARRRSLSAWSWRCRSGAAAGCGRSRWRWPSPSPHAR